MANGSVNAAVRLYKCVFGRNLQDTDETNSILEIRLTLYCPIFEEIKSFFLMYLIFLIFGRDTFHFDVGLILYFLQCIYKKIMLRTVK
jgi:hypothetical protein